MADHRQCMATFQHADNLLKHPNHNLAWQWWMRIAQLQRRKFVGFHSWYEIAPGGGARMTATWGKPLPSSC